jgi:hypothetical protein
MTTDPNDEGFRSYVVLWVQAIYGNEAAHILARIDDAEQRTVGRDEVILLGFAGQVDALWKCPEPRPETLHHGVLSPPSGPAEYRRVGVITYLRIP